MRQLEARLRQRHPRWFDGRRARLAAPVLRSMARWSRLDAVQAFVEAQGATRGLAFVAAALSFLGVRYAVAPDALARIPASGRLLVVANHPSGALDALALLDCIGRVRGDVCIVANDLLEALEPIADLLLPVRILGGRPCAASVQAIERALHAERCVVVFPAGEVSRLSLRGVRDSHWRRGFVRFAHRTGAPVLPVRVEARNSALFYGASALFRPAGTAMLVREMFARRTRTMRLCVGAPMRLDPAGDPLRQLREVRHALYALRGGGPAAADHAPPAHAPLAPAADRDRLAADVAATELLGRTGDGHEIRLADGASAACLLDEIGRLRELAFRRVGEGTGRSRDLDEFDARYQHILVWDAQARRVLGAYRIARGAPTLARAGLSGFYTASLFRYADAMIPRLAEGMELGRSFVVPEAWGGPGLDYLWQGIGAYLQRHPGVRYLFGAVSISATLPAPAQAGIVAYYRRYYGGEAGLAEARRPFRFDADEPVFDAPDARTALDALRTRLAGMGASIPVLFRQYTELCEPGGARFLAFGVDPDFSDSIDGLIEVDLHRLRARKRQRYLVPTGATA